MRIQLLAPLFSLVLIGIQGYLFENLAYAKHNPDHCCMCSKCKSTCWCGGQANCPKCHTTDGDSIPEIVSSNNLPIINLRRIAHLESERLIPSIAVDELITHVRLTRWRENSTLRMPNYLVEHIEFECLRLDS